MNNSWEEIVIVGFGNHAKTKILPAIIKTSNAKISLLTNKKVFEKDFHQIYKSLDQALNKSRKKLFIISNPPKFHYEFCKKIMLNDFDVFVEKPSFLEINHLKDLIEIANEKKIVLFEMFMYLENIKIIETFNMINSQLKSINSIYTSFNLPTYPKNTFRNERDFSSSLFVDMVAYPISLVNLINLNIRDIIINSRSSINDKEANYNFCITGDRFNIYINIGVSGIYSNNLRILFNNGNYNEISPFYYGRSHFQRVIKKDKYGLNIKNHYQSNAFEKIFSKTRSTLLQSQNERFEYMKINLKLLEKLKFKLF